MYISISDAWTGRRPQAGVASEGAEGRSLQSPEAKRRASRRISPSELPFGPDRLPAVSLQL